MKASLAKRASRIFMRIFIAIVGLVMIVAILWDAFETIVLPRRVTRKFRFTRLFYRLTWNVGSAFARRISFGKRREKYLGFYGPLSLILLISLWAFGLILGYALTHYGLQSPVNSPEGRATFGTYLYASGETFFTLGYGDVTPLNRFGRFLAVLEVGTGFAFLAIVIGYLPVIYQAFSRREVAITMLDARAGSPSTATELVRRHAERASMNELVEMLREWEHWAADLLESHLSYPVLSYYRSQHDNQSWLGALTTVLDTCALVMVGVEGVRAWQAQLTFAMARHAVVDIAQIFNAAPRQPVPDRLPPADLARLRATLAAAGARLRDGAESERKLKELREMYEPYVCALSKHLLMPLPPWTPARAVSDNWRTSAWGRLSAGIEPSSAAPLADEEHL